MDPSDLPAVAPTPPSASPLHPEASTAAAAAAAATGLPFLDGCSTTPCGPASQGHGTPLAQHHAASSQNPRHAAAYHADVSNILLHKQQQKPRQQKLAERQQRWRTQGRIAMAVAGSLRALIGVLEGHAGSCGGAGGGTGGSDAALAELYLMNNLGHVVMRLET